LTSEIKTKINKKKEESKSNKIEKKQEQINKISIDLRAQSNIMLKQFHSIYLETQK